MPKELSDAEVDKLLEKFDLTELKLQRKIVAALIVDRDEKSERLKTARDLIEAAFMHGCCEVPIGPFAGWYDSAASSTYLELGDWLVDVGAWERHAEGRGRRQFYRKL